MKREGYSTHGLGPSYLWANFFGRKGPDGYAIHSGSSAFLLANQYRAVPRSLGRLSRFEDGYLGRGPAGLIAGAAPVFVGGLETCHVSKAHLTFTY